MFFLLPDTPFQRAYDAIISIVSHTNHIHISKEGRGVGFVSFVFIIVLYFVSQPNRLYSHARHRLYDVSNRCHQRSKFNVLPDMKAEFPHQKQCMMFILFFLSFIFPVCNITCFCFLAINFLIFFVLCRSL